MKRLNRWKGWDKEEGLCFILRGLKLYNWDRLQNAL